MIANLPLRKNVSLSKLISMTPAEIGLLFGTITTAISGLVMKAIAARTQAKVDVVSTAVSNQKIASELHTKEIQDMQAMVNRYQTQFEENLELIKTKELIIAQLQTDLNTIRAELTQYRNEAESTIRILKGELELQIKTNKALNIEIEHLTTRVRDLEQSK